MLGQLYFSHHKQANDVIDLLLNGKKETFDLNVAPYDIIVLANNQILTTNYNEKCLTIYDENLELVKKVNRINNEIFGPIAIVLLPEEETFYILDCSNHRILVTDSDFKFVKSFGSFGKSNNQFSHPYDLCFITNNDLCVCDYYNKRIQIYSKSLKFLKSLKIDFNPWKIKASNSILFVQSINGICFYNLNDLSFVQSFNHGICRLSKIDSNIYEVNYKTKKLFCYDEKANLKVEMNFTFNEENLKDSQDGAFVELNEKLYMISASRKKIFKLSK